MTGVDGQDRRVRRTRRTLHDALIALILEKGYERVTVQDILDRADVGRSTFYAHYRDKDALLFTSFDGMEDDLRREIRALAPGDPLVRPDRPAAVVFEHAYRNQRVYRALCGRAGGSLVYRHLHRTIGGILREHLRPHLAAAGSKVPADVVAEFYASGVLGLLVWWIDQGFPHDAAWLSGLARTLAVPGVRAALGTGTPVPTG